MSKQKAAAEKHWEQDREPQAPRILSHILLGNRWVSTGLAERTSFIILFFLVWCHTFHPWRVKCQTKREPTRKILTKLWHGLQHSLQQKKAIILIGVHNRHSPKEQMNWCRSAVAVGEGREEQGTGQGGRCVASCISAILPQQQPAHPCLQSLARGSAETWTPPNPGLDTRGWPAEELLPCLEGFPCTCGTFSQVLGERRDTGAMRMRGTGRRGQGTTATSEVSSSHNKNLHSEKASTLKSLFRAKSPACYVHH